MRQGNLVYTEPNYLDPDKPFVTIPPEYGATHRKGCMYDTHWDLPVLSTTSQNGGPDWSSYSFSHKLGLIFLPYGVNPVAHWRGAGGNGQRALGQYQTGGILAHRRLRRTRCAGRTSRAWTWRTARARSRPRAISCSSACSTATSSRWTP